MADDWETMFRERRKQLDAEKEFLERELVPPGVVERIEFDTSTLGASSGPGQTLKLVEEYGWEHRIFAARYYTGEKKIKSRRIIKPGKYGTLLGLEAMHGLVGIRISWSSTGGGWTTLYSAISELEPTETGRLRAVKVTPVPAKQIRETLEYEEAAA